MKLFGSSGIRAVYDKDLLDTAFKVGLAVGRNYKNVVVGRDTRTSGDAMKHAVIAGLLAAGARCRDAGITPTPTLAYVTREFDAGVMITASHNPPEYNGLKLLNPDGSSFDSLQQTQIENMIMDESFDDGGVGGGKAERCLRRSYRKPYQRYPAGLSVRVEYQSGGGCRLRGGFGGHAAPAGKARVRSGGFELLSQRLFPARHRAGRGKLEELCRTVKESGAAVGIAHDGDADRMMAVDERGRFITGDKMLAILARAVGAKEVVTTLDASMAIDEMGLKVRRTRIGDTWVSEELRKGGDFGGETSGAWIFPAISLCPDGIYAAAQIAALAAKYSLAELVDAVPVYPLIRGSVSSRGVAMSRLEAELMALKPLSGEQNRRHETGF